jgi:hypothetical protein
LGAEAVVGEAMLRRGWERRWSSMGGGVILTLGEETARLAPKTELLFPPRLQEEAASDLEGTMPTLPVPSEVPPLMTVVMPGVWGISP